jgi:exodeoxyribonuclease-3
MRIATWNVNSVRQRLDHLLTWLRDCGPDIVCLQEIKCVDEAFPREAIEALGYNVVTHGQKTFNGVALLSKLPFEETKSGLAGDDEDAHARLLEGVVTLTLFAQWQSAGDREISLQAQMDVAASGVFERAA